MKIVYDAEADALHILFQETTVTTKHLAEGIAADYDRNGQLAGIEILDARQRCGDEDSLRHITLEGFEGVVPVFRYQGVSGYYYAEALTWLQQGDGEDEWRAVGDSSERLSAEDSLSLARELYAAGAVEVRVQGKYLNEEGESGDYFEIVLPQDPAARSALFEIGRRIMADTGSPFDPAEEQGQPTFTIGW